MKLPRTLSLLLACLFRSLVAGEAPPSAEITIVRKSTMTREVERVEKGKQAKKVKRVIDTVVLENRFIELTFCPALGERIAQVRDKVTGRKLLYEGVIKYSGSALDEGAENVDPPSEDEVETVEMCSGVEGARLGCQLKVNGDITVRQLD